MLHEEVQSLACELADRSVIRADAIDAWVSLALEQSDPNEWVSAMVAAALDKLNTVPETLTVKAEARLQLLDIRRAIFSGIARNRADLTRTRLTQAIA
jgi:hypothetical protein